MYPRQRLARVEIFNFTQLNLANADDDTIALAGRSPDGDVNQRCYFVTDACDCDDSCHGCSHVLISNGYVDYELGVAVVVDEVHVPSRYPEF